MAVADQCRLSSGDTSRFVTPDRRVDHCGAVEVLWTMKGARIELCDLPSRDGDGSEDLWLVYHGDIDVSHPLLLDDWGLSPEVTVTDIEVVEG